ncbi:MAG TPA: response regulator [Stellaceae bacterium]|nr:response regulator [Stellaceae bacterium]
MTTDSPVLNGSAASAKIVVGVDDAPENLKMLEAAVLAGGYTFVGAASGIKCVSMLTRMVPRLILLDIEMPDIDGFETCRRIRLSPELRHVPVAFLTARRATEDVKQGLAVGGNDFIIKPFDIVKLLERIKYWTARTIHA